MKNKYYTPEKKEFYIGFEYESQEMSPSGASVDWKPQVFEEQDNLNSIFQINSWFDGPRVQYLSNKDIESFGLNHIGGKLNGKTLQNFSGKVEKGYWLHLIVTHFSFGSVITIETSVYKNSERTLVVHTITIKNKSELKILLKQLKIKEE